jgi:uncharacterized protein YggE
VKKLLIALALTTAAPVGALAQTIATPVPATASNGVRLDVVATGEVTRAPDQVTVMAGVVTRASQASAALRDNAERMERVRTALRGLGIQARDIQTGTISLNQDYERPREPMAGGGRPEPSGYVASNQLTIRFRDVANAGRIIDALVGVGVNNVQGPMFGLSNQAAALDEARTRALTAARARADLYAKALGTRVRRIVSVSETGQAGIVMGEAASMRMQTFDVSTKIEPGEQLVSTNLTVTFELDQPRG